MRNYFTIQLAVRAWALCLMMSIAVVGCNKANKPTDATLAKDSLKAALDAWKGGAKMSEMSSRSPSMVVAEPEWESGKQLKEYEFAGPETDDGVNLHCPVRLKLAGSDGQERETVVTYVVGTDPVITVFRENL